MDWENEVLMSCAPKWANHVSAENVPVIILKFFGLQICCSFILKCLLNWDFQWRDHWMQAAYFPKKFQHFEKGEQLQVSCNHDEYSLWFDIGKLNDSLTASEQSLGNTIVSRNRLGQINDRQRNDMFLKLLKKVRKNLKLKFIDPVLLND